ncbi:MAG: nucleotidyltransferase family protein [Solirubrobacterales bacterium]
MIAGVVLAAGAATRFGAPKQVAPLAGKPLLEHVVLVAASLDRTVVVLGADAEEVLDRVPLHGAEPIVCSDWRRGLAASLAAGLEAIPEAEAAVVLLGDQPLVSPAAIERVLGARSPDVAAVRATYGGEPMHPVVLERTIFEAMTDLADGEQPRTVLSRLPMRLVACDGLGSPVDVDTRATLAGIET